MRVKNLRGLIVLNAAILAVLAAVTFGPAVSAQQRPRGVYTMVAGGVPGMITAVVYIVDESNQELVAVVWDKNQKQLTGIGYANLATDGENLMRRRP